MSDEKLSVPFNVTAGAPTRVMLTGVDGRTYVIKLVVAVFDVRDNGHADDPTRFDVHAEIALAVEAAG